MFETAYNSNSINTTANNYSISILEMVYTTYIKLRILHHHFKGTKPYTIARALEEEGITVSRFGVHKFIKLYTETGSIERKPGSGRLTKITTRVKELVEAQMEKDDETTAYQLHQMLVESGIEISLMTILRCRTTLGWTFRGSAYCQLIRQENKVKRLEWCRRYKNEDFKDVIWTDESTIQLENHRRFCCRKVGQAPKPKPRYVHL